MKDFKFPFSVLLLLFYFTGALVNAQEEQKLIGYYDSIVGYKNLSILNGVEALNPYRTINEKHPYFSDPDFVKGSIIYDGEPFRDVFLRYDMFRDIVTIKLKNTVGGTLLFDLISDKVSEFEINNHRFINLKFKKKFDSGFYEIIYTSLQLSIYQKRYLKPLDKRDKEILYYEFDQLPDHYVFYTTPYGYFYPSEDFLLENYERCSSPVNDFINRNKKLKKQNQKSYLIELGKLLTTLDCSQNRTE